MYAQHKRKKRLMSEINVVPYIDVMLVLLVIFMITAPLLTQGIKVDLPEAQARPVNIQDNETIVVTVDKKGAYYLDDREIGVEALREKVSKILRLRPQTPVVVRGDHQVSYGKVVAVMTILQEAGAPTVGLATQSPKQSER